MQALCKDAPKLCTVSCAVDPPSMKWSDLKYVIWHQGGPICRGRGTSLRRLSRSCGRLTFWSRKAAFSPDGKRIVTASEDKTARLWDAETGKPIGEPLKGHQGLVSSAAFSPDGKPLSQRLTTNGAAVGRRDWQTNRNAVRRSAPTSIAASPLLRQCGAPVARLHRNNRPAAQGRKLSTGETIEDVASYGATVAPFSPDGRRIVTAYDGRTARLWDGETGKPIGEPLNHGSVKNAAFSPDLKRVVTVSPGAQTARLWDAETGQPIGEPLHHLNVVYSAAFSPDGKRIVTAWAAAAGGGTVKANRRAAEGSCGRCIKCGVQPRRQAHCHSV